MSQKCISSIGIAGMLFQGDGGRGKMCKAIEDIIEKRRIDTLEEIMKNLMDTTGLTAEEAMLALRLSEDDKKQLINRV